MACRCRGGSPADDGGRDGLHGVLSPFLTPSDVISAKVLAKSKSQFLFLSNQDNGYKELWQAVWCLQSTSLDYFSNSYHHYFWNQTSERLWSLPERGLKCQTAPPIKRADSETWFHGERGEWFPTSWRNKSPNTSCTPPIQVCSDTVYLREPQLPRRRVQDCPKLRCQSRGPVGTWAPNSLDTYWRNPPWTSDIRCRFTLSPVLRGVGYKSEDPTIPSLGLANLPDQCTGLRETFYLLCCSVAKLCLTLWDPMNCSTPGFPVLHYFLELAQTHFHWVSDAIQPSHPLSPPSAFNLSQHQSLFQWVGSSHQVAKVLELELQHQPFWEISSHLITVGPSATSTPSFSCVQNVTLLTGTQLWWEGAHYE